MPNADDDRDQDADCFTVVDGVTYFDASASARWRRWGQWYPTGEADAVTYSDTSDADGRAARPSAARASGGDVRPPPAG
jgi:hypothetical protein